MKKIGKIIRNACKIIFSRTIITFLLLIAQLLLLLTGFRYISGYILTVSNILAAVMIVYIINTDDDPAYKLAWMIPICLIPIPGILMYLFLELNIGGLGLKKDLEKRLQETKKYLHTGKQVSEDLKSEERRFADFSEYLETSGGYPTFEHTDAMYFPLGENKFKQLLIDLDKAEHFIFMEYFIIEEGNMWNTVLDILKRKAAEGVEVRVMYDGMCSILLLPYSYPKKLEKMGIQAKMFSPIKPFLSTRQNNRDHRKVLVIDGKIAYTGGINMADEYINQKVIYGHWKDVGIRVEGDAAEGFTLMFLQMWNVSEKGMENYEKYLCKEKGSIKGSGYVIPYADSPKDRENVGENVYLDMLYTAKRYVHIMTPYLIIDSEMQRALEYAAKRGVDVKLLLPHIPDKKIPFYIARTYYPGLLRAGVSIYEYTPGFVHGKSFVSDDEKAVVGSVNLDYRSLYLHFECGAYLYRNSAIADIEQDYQDTLKKCMKIDMAYYEKTKVLNRLTGRIFRLFAPLM